MRRITLASLAFLGAASLAPSALADGREPGSILIYPIQRSSLLNPAVFNVVNVTNTNRNGNGETDLHFQYVNVSPSPFLFADCSIENRVETLTPADTLSVLTSCHNAGTNVQGYLVVSARNPALVDTYWSFNHLIGSEQIVSAGGGMYSLNALPFKSTVAAGGNTDVNPADGRRDFNDLEYEKIPDQLYIDNFIGAIAGDLILLTFLGGEYLVNVKFDIFNDDEFQLSGDWAFSCWTRVPLASISGFFTEQGLSTSANDPDELDITCDMNDDLNTGWAIVRTTNAISLTSPGISNPPLLAAVANDAAPFMYARLLWESVAKQSASFGDA